jgi:glycosyltransferase involved in cell wall biosynthesis
MMLSVIIPAFNEEKYLPATLDHVRQASQATLASGKSVEIIVVDNASSDRTAEVAVTHGAKVVSVPEHNVARVRNAGARAASGEILVFLDADTLVPLHLLSRIAEEMGDLNCLGGAVDTDYQPVRTLMRLYLRLWRIIGHAFGMAQGALQFCRRDIFFALKGYDESIYMGEDVDFYWRLRKLAKCRGQSVQLLTDVRVVPSCRRFDQWPTHRILIETNPIYIMFLQRSKTAWCGWYRDVPR